MLYDPKWDTETKADPSVLVGGYPVSLNRDRFHLSAAFEEIPHEHPRTYGAALERARKVAAQTSA